MILHGPLRAPYVRLWLTDVSLAGMLLNCLLPFSSSDGDRFACPSRCRLKKTLSAGGHYTDSCDDSPLRHCEEGPVRGGVREEVEIAQIAEVRNGGAVGNDGEVRNDGAGGAFRGPGLNDDLKYWIGPG